MTTIESNGKNGEPMGDIVDIDDLVEKAILLGKGRYHLHKLLDEFIQTIAMLDHQIKQLDKKNKALALVVNSQRGESKTTGRGKKASVSEVRTDASASTPSKDKRKRRPRPPKKSSAPVS